MTEPEADVVSKRINDELPLLERVVKRMQDNWRRYKLKTEDAYLDSVALSLHDWYTGVERVFLAIADEIDRSTPHGRSWHRDLLRQMTLELASRPPVIPQPLEERLGKLLGFRHVVRNVYATSFDPRLVEIHVSDLEQLHADTSAALSTFARWLQAL